MAIEKQLLCGFAAAVRVERALLWCNDGSKEASAAELLALLRNLMRL